MNYHVKMLDMQLLRGMYCQTVRSPAPAQVACMFRFAFTLSNIGNFLLKRRKIALSDFQILLHEADSRQMCRLLLARLSQLCIKWWTELGVGESSYFFGRNTQLFLESLLTIPLCWLYSKADDDPSLPITYRYYCSKFGWRFSYHIEKVVLQFWHWPTKGLAEHQMTNSWNKLEQNINKADKTCHESLSHV